MNTRVLLGIRALQSASGVPILLCLLLLVVLAFSSCGGGGAGLNPVVPGLSGGGAEQTDIDLGATGSGENAAPDFVNLEDALAELESMVVPPGVDEDIFKVLKAELKRALLERDDQRMVAGEPPVRSWVKPTGVTVYRDEPRHYLLQWDYQNRGDYDLNSQVGVSDLTPLGMVMTDHGTTDIEGPFDPDSIEARCDGNGDGWITIHDIAPIGQSFGTTVTEYVVQGALASGGRTWVQVDDYSPFESGGALNSALLTYEIGLPGYDYYRVVPYLGGSEGEASDEDGVIKLQPNAVPVGPETGLVFSHSDDDWYYFEVPVDATDPVELGDVLVGAGDVGVGEYGYLLTVTEVQEAGSNLIGVKGDYAGLEDALLDGWFEHQLPIRGSTVIHSGKQGSVVSDVKQAASVFDPIVLNLDDTQLYNDGPFKLTIPEGEVRFQPDFTIAADCSWLGGLESFEASATGALSVELDVLAEIDVQGAYAPEPMRVGDPFLQHFGFFVGPWPVAGIAELQFYLGAEAHGELRGTATTGFDFEAAATAGAEWRKGRVPEEWQNISGLSWEFDLHDLTIEANGHADVRLYLIAELEIKLYYIVGPTIEVVPYVQLDLDASYPPVEYSGKLYWGADARAGLVFEFFGCGVDYTESFILLPPTLIGEISGGGPRCPRDLQASDGAYTDKVKVTWDHPADGPTPGTYKVYRNGGFKGSVVYPQDYYEDFDVTAGATYSYHVTSYISDHGESGPSNVDDGYARSTDNQPPIADLGALPTSGPAPLTVSFNATGSTDEDGIITKYEWDWDGNGSWDYDSGTDGTVQHTYNTAGTYWAEVRVTDDDGATDTDLVSITPGQPPNVPPVADLSASPTSGLAPLTVSFNATGSTDEDGIITKYEWDWDGNGSWDYDSGTDGTVQHTYNTAGTYWAEVRVTDDDGATDTDLVQIDAEKGVLSPPENLAATDGFHMDRVRLTWSHPSAGPTPDGYKLYRATSQFGSYAPQDTVGYVTQWDDTSATPGTTYWYKATSYKSGYSDSGYSYADDGYRAEDSPYDETEHNDSKGQADAMPSFPVSSWLGNLGSGGDYDGDTVDWSKFDVSTPGKVTVAMVGTGSGENLDMYVYDYSSSSGEYLLAESTGSGSTESFTFFPPYPATMESYYLKSAAAGGNSDYTLSLSKTSGWSDLGESNNSVGSAYSVSPGLQGATLQSGSDEVDYYKFTVSSASTKFTRLQLSDYWHTYSFDPPPYVGLGSSYDYGVIGDADDDPSDNGSFSGEVWLPLSPGTYYFKAFHPGGSKMHYVFEYSLNTTYPGGWPRDGDGSSFGKPAQAGLQNEYRGISDGASDHEYWRRSTNWGSSTHWITLVHTGFTQGDDLDLYIYDPADPGNAVAYSCRHTAGIEEVTFPASSGIDYVIEVYVHSQANTKCFYSLFINMNRFNFPI